MTQNRSSSWCMAATMYLDGCYNVPRRAINGQDPGVLPSDPVVLHDARSLSTGAGSADRLGGGGASPARLRDRDSRGSTWRARTQAAQPSAVPCTARTRAPTQQCPLEQSRPASAPPAPRPPSFGIAFWGQPAACRFSAPRLLCLEATAPEDRPRLASRARRNDRTPCPRQVRTPPSPSAAPAQSIPASMHRMPARSVLFACTWGRRSRWCHLVRYDFVPWCILNPKVPEPHQTARVDQEMRRLDVTMENYRLLRIGAV